MVVKIYDNRMKYDGNMMELNKLNNYKIKLKIKLDGSGLIWIMVCDWDGLIWIF